MSPVAAAAPVAADDAEVAKASDETAAAVLVLGCGLTERLLSGDAAGAYALLAPSAQEALAAVVPSLTTNRVLGSIVVRPGQQVAAGDPLGQCGNTGNSCEPHLHIHVQNVVDIYDPQGGGLPVRFSDDLADGKPVTEGVPTQGQFISPVG